MALSTAVPHPVRAGLGENDRQRLRRELHDGVGSTLAAIGLQLEQAEALTICDPERARTLLRTIHGAIGSMVVEVRRIAYELEAPDLADLGLPAVINARAQALREGGVHVQLSMPASSIPMPAGVEAAIGAVASEAMARLGGARCCTVRLGFGATAELEVCQAGSAPILDESLDRLRRRVQSLGGTLELDGRLRVAIPLGR